MKKNTIITSIIFIIFICFYSIAEARAWWWSSSSGWWDAIWVALAILIYAIYKIRREKMIKKAKKDLEDALKEDSSWDLIWLKKIVEDIFVKYQNARSEKNLSSIMSYMTKDYYEKAIRILVQKLDGKKNIIKDINILGLTLMSVRNFPWRDWDMFAMEVSASMIDYTIDEKTWEFIESTIWKLKKESYEDYKRRAMNISSSFMEYYIFVRYNWKWLLNNIKEEFSIVKDIINLNETELTEILKKEESSETVDDSILYSD